MDGIVKRVAVAVLLLAVVGLGACGEDGDQVEAGRSPAPSETWRAALARILAVPEAQSVWAGSVGAEVSDLIRLRRFAEIEFVDAELQRRHDVDRRNTIHHSLASRSAEPEVMALLRRLAARDRQALRLAPYREGGVAHLLEVLEDEDASVAERMTSARLLGQFGGLHEMRRMDRLSHGSDERAVETDNESWEPLRLGDVVRESIQSIRDRVGER